MGMSTTVGGEEETLTKRTGDGRMETGILSIKTAGNSLLTSDKLVLLCTNSVVFLSAIIAVVQHAVFWAVANRAVDVKS